MNVNSHSTHSILLAIIEVLFVMCIFNVQISAKQRSTQISDTTRIKNDLLTITKTEGFRNHENLEILNFVADHIYQEFSKYCDTTYYQKYIVDGIEYKNVIARIGLNEQEKIVIGAHYDVAGDQEGADDNASGVVGLLELAQLISAEPVKHQIEFVAYTLEELPHFRTENMGSFVHAKSLYDNKEKIKGMICLEMIGYFDDSKDSQDYPVGLLKLFYGNKGDYITVVQKFGNGKFGRRVKREMKKQKLIKTKSFKGPAKLPGIDFSDHLNYWMFDYSAVMITDTAFYRNLNYHEESDTLETLDIKRMALVIDQVYLSLKVLD